MRKAPNGRAHAYAFGLCRRCLGIEALFGRLCLCLYNPVSRKRRLRFEGLHDSFAINGADYWHSIPNDTVRNFKNNENTNGLLRQYFPKGADLSMYSQTHLNKVARQLKERPRKTLEFETPAERFNACVASTG